MSPHIILTGGEPTPLPFLPDVIRYADGLGQIVGMNTNAAGCRHRAGSDVLVEAGLNHVQVTLSRAF